MSTAKRGRFSKKKEEADGDADAAFAQAVADVATSAGDEDNTGARAAAAAVASETTADDNKNDTTNNGEAHPSAEESVTRPPPSSSPATTAAPAPPARKYILRRKVYVRGGINFFSSEEDVAAFVGAIVNRVAPGNAKISLHGKGSHNAEGDQEDVLHFLVECDQEDVMGKLTAAVNDAVDERRSVPSANLIPPNTSTNTTTTTTMTTTSGNLDGDSSQRKRLLDGSMAREMPVTHTRTLDIPAQFAGAFIGRQGENIKQVQNASGAKILIASEQRDGMRTLTISSVNLEAVEKAIQIITDFVRGKEESSGLGGGGDEANQLSEAFEVPTVKAGYVIGRMGNVIKGMQAKFGARITVAPADPPDAPTRLVTIAARSRETIMAVRTEIDGIVNGTIIPDYPPPPAPAPVMGGGGMMGLGGGVGGGFNRSGLGQPGGGGPIPPGHTELIVKIPHSKAGLVIGKGGQTIKGLQDRNHVKITLAPIPDPGTEDRSAYVVGLPADVRTCVSEILEVLGSNVRPTVINAPGTGMRPTPMSAMPGSVAMGGGGFAGGGGGGAAAPTADYSQQWAAYYATFALLSPQQQQVAMAQLTPPQQYAVQQAQLAHQQQQQQQQARPGMSTSQSTDQFAAWQGLYNPASANNNAGNLRR